MKPKDLLDADIIIIYTADVKRESVELPYKNGTVTINLIPAFLSELPVDTILPNLEARITNHTPLTDDELMQLIVLPLAYRTKKVKQKMIRKAVDLAIDIKDENTQAFALAGLLVFADKVVDAATKNYVMRRIAMTSFGKLFEDQKRESNKLVADLVAELVQAKVLVDDVRQGAKDFGMTVANYCSKRNLTQKYDDSVSLLKKRKATNMTLDEIKALAITAA